MSLTLCGSHLGLGVRRSLTLSIMPGCASLYLFYLLKEEASLIMADPFAKQDAIRSHCIAALVWYNSSLSFYSGSLS